MGESAPKRPLPPEPESAERRAERAFKVFDKNHDGFVTKDEMLRLCKNLSKEQVTDYSGTKISIMWRNRVGFPWR